MVCPRSSDVTGVCPSPWQHGFRTEPQSAQQVDEFEVNLRSVFALGPDVSALYSSLAFHERNVGKTILTGRLAWKVIIPMWIGKAAPKK